MAYISILHQIFLCCSRLLLGSSSSCSHIKWVRFWALQSWRPIEIITVLLILNNWVRNITFMRLHAWWRSNILLVNLFPANLSGIFLGQLSVYYPLIQLFIKVEVAVSCWLLSILFSSSCIWISILLLVLLGLIELIAASQIIISIILWFASLVCIWWY